MKPCPECGGTGGVLEMDEDRQPTGPWTPCPRCGGSGEVASEFDDPPEVEATDKERDTRSGA